MNNQIIGIVVGGLVPALLFGFSGVLQKTAQRTGITMSWYIIFLGLGVLTAGIPLLFTESAKQISTKGGITTLLIGFFWALGMVAVATAITKFGVPVSKLAPLYNMNTLVAVVLGLLIYSEWKNLNTASLLIGAVFIIIGGVLVAKS